MTIQELLEIARRARVAPTGGVSPSQDPSLAATPDPTQAMSPQEAISPPGAAQQTMVQQPQRVAPVAQDIAPPPMSQQPYLQAEQLTAQARPPKPMGFLDTMAEAMAAPPGTHQQRAVAERQREQDLLGRAKELRGEGFQQSQALVQQQSAQQNRDLQQQQFSRLQSATESENAARSAAQERADRTEAARVEAQKNELKFGPAGSGVFKGGELIGQIPKEKTAQDRFVDRIDPTTKHVIRRYFDENYQPVHEEDRGLAPTSQTAQPGSMQPTVDAYGNITAMVDTETGNITPPHFAPGIKGPIRKTAAAPGLIQQSQETDTSYNQLSKLGELYRDEFVGPLQGRALAVKSKLPESMASLPKGYTDFAALQSDATNAFIKFMTGAQMSEPEARRLTKQMPTGEARGDVWQSNYKNMMRRVNFVKGMLDKGLDLQGMTADQLDKAMEGKPVQPKGTPSFALKPNEILMTDPAGKPHAVDKDEAKNAPEGWKVVPK